MRKKSQDELGTLLTREIRVMLQDKSLTKEQRFDILAAIMFDAPLKTPILASFAKSLKTGYDYANNKTFAATNSHRKSAKEYEQRKREELKRLREEIERNGNQLPSIDINGNQLSSIDGINKQINKQGISPYKPPKGGKKVPDKVRPEDLFGKPGKKGGGRCRFMDARGFCTNEAMQGGGFKCMGPECEGREVVASEGVRVATVKELTETLAQDIEQTEAFGRMRVNRRNLMRHLLPIVKKNCAAEGEDERASHETRRAFWKLHKTILDGLAAWTTAWKADDWQYAPGKITKWLADEKYLQPPRKKTAAPESVGSGCGDCGAEIA